jgi:hypothetical protein
MNQGTIHDWKIGRLFMSVTTERPGLRVGKEGNDLLFFGPTGTIKLNLEMIADSRDVKQLAAFVLENLK